MFVGSIVYLRPLRKISTVSSSKYCICGEGIVVNSRIKNKRIRVHTGSLLNDSPRVNTVSSDTNMNIWQNLEWDKSFVQFLVSQTMLDLATGGLPRYMFIDSSRSPKDLSTLFWSSMWHLNNYIWALSFASNITRTSSLLMIANIP